jgi:molybdopterin converting factor small subunit
MSIHVEFYGIPRQRAGVSTTEAKGSCLGDVLRDLEHRFPELQATCIANGQLVPGYTANIGGERFIGDPATELCDGDVLLILSADAGG